MPRQKTAGGLAPELEAIATAAAERLRAQTEGDRQREDDLRRSVGEAASGAIGAGLPLGAIAEAERAGEARARGELSADLLRRVELAARRKHEADDEYEQAVVHAARLGLAQRDVAAAAGVAHGTVRAILARSETITDATALPATRAGTDGHDPEKHGANGSHPATGEAGEQR
ncbi:MAG: hypothetical protein ACLP0J_15160 [Solirubrobacteraceae bacterium]